MFAKIIIISSVVATALALAPGYVSPAYALGSQAEHTIRGYGGVSSVSKQAKAIDSPYATVRKTDIRVTNDAAYATHSAVAPYGYAHPGHGYATPTIAHGYHHGPAITHGYHTAPAYTQGYNTPTLTHGYHSPAGAITYAHRGFSGVPAPYGYASGPVHAPVQTHFGYSNAPLGYAARGVALPTAHVAKSVAVPGGLGVAYSPATAVATSSFSGYGVHYGY